jgi:hypothetical protein
MLPVGAPLNIVTSTHAISSQGVMSSCTSTGSSTTFPSVAPAVISAKPTSIQYMLKNILFPAAKKYLVCPRSFADATKMDNPMEKVFTVVTRLEDLYKVFERC